jgi:hypothetical protein
MPVSPTAPSCPGTRVDAPLHIAFRIANGVGTRNFCTFTAQWLAYALLYHIGRKATYFVFFLLGIATYALAPWVPGPVNSPLKADRNRHLRPEVIATLVPEAPSLCKVDLLLTVRLYIA